MIKYYEIRPYYNDPFDDICKMTGMSADDLAIALGFENWRDKMANLIFQDITDVAYIRRLNRFLKEKNLPLRFSQEISRRRYDEYRQSRCSSN